MCWNFSSNLNLHSNVESVFIPVFSRTVNTNSQQKVYPQNTKSLHTQPSVGKIGPDQIHFT